MKLIKIIIPTIIAFLVTSLVYKNFNFYTLNIGAIWVNIKLYQIIILGLLFSLAIVYIHNKQILIFYKLLFSFFAVITIVLAIDSISNLKNYSVLCFLMILLGIIICIDFKDRKLKSHNK